MKRLMVLGLMLMASKANALSFKDNIQNWRTLEISTGQPYVLLATACPCYVYDLTVTTGSGNNVGNTWFQFYWSTVTAGYNPGERVSNSSNLSVSTSPRFQTDRTADRFIIEEVITSSSVFYAFTGSSTIRLRWDYWNSAPKGNYEGNGRKPQKIIFR